MQAKQHCNPTIYALHRYTKTPLCAGTGINGCCTRSSYARHYNSGINSNHLMLLQHARGGLRAFQAGRCSALKALPAAPWYTPSTSTPHLNCSRCSMCLHTAYSAVFTVPKSNLQTTQLCAAAAAQMLHFTAVKAPPKHLWTLCQRHTRSMHPATLIIIPVAHPEESVRLYRLAGLSRHINTPSCFDDPPSCVAHVLCVAIIVSWYVHHCLLSSAKLVQSGCEMEAVSACSTEQR